MPEPKNFNIVSKSILVTIALLLCVVVFVGCGLGEEKNHEQESIHSVKVLCNHVIRGVEFTEGGRIRSVQCQPYKP